MPFSNALQRAQDGANVPPVRPARWVKNLDLWSPPKAHRREDASHVGHDGAKDSLSSRLEQMIKAGRFANFAEKITQLGSYGGGNHFGECEIVRLGDNDRAKRAAEVFGLRDRCAGFLSHCGSRGFGHLLA